MHLQKVTNIEAVNEKKIIFVIVVAVVKATTKEKYSTALLVQHRAVWRNQLSRLAQKSQELLCEG
jgi:hypothetical protein